MAFNYTAPNGLKFRTVVNQFKDCGNQTGCDLNLQIDTRNIITIQECMILCSNTDPLCYGVSFDDTKGICYLRGVAMNDLTDTPGYSSALANSSQIVVKASNCSSGVIDNYCNATCDIQYGSLNRTSLQQNLPAGTFEQCSDLCVHARPLCKSFTWDSTKANGFNNCYLYNSVSRNLSSQSVSGLQNCEVLASNYKNITPPADISGYTIHSGIKTGRGYNTIGYALQHVQSLEACTSACTADINCGAVNLDLTYAHGYQNCELLTYGEDNTGGFEADAGFINAFNYNHPEPTGQGPASVDSSGETPKAWIAAPIIVGILLFLLIAFRHGRHRRDVMRAKRLPPSQRPPPMYQPPARRGLPPLQAPPAYDTTGTT